MKLKKTLKFLLPVFIIILVAFYLLVLFPPFLKGEIKAKEQAAEIIEVWHVDSFEGGSGSRAEFLRSRASEFEKNNKEKYILVRNMTEEQLLTALESGFRPDIFSFSHGLGGSLVYELAETAGEVNAFEGLKKSGVLSGKQFAVPWCAGGYFVAGNKSYIKDGVELTGRFFNYEYIKKGEKLYSSAVGYSPYNNPLMAAYAFDKELRITGMSLNKEAAYTQYEAYAKFVGGGESVFLLGTQRDAVRIQNRENSAGFALQPLNSFSDLVCYAGIQKDTKSYNLCGRFIEFLLSSECQVKLKTINMFSSNLDSLYESGAFCEFERGLKDIKTLNAFTDAEILKDLRSTALEALCGDGEAGKKLGELF